MPDSRGVRIGIEFCANISVAGRFDAFVFVCVAKKRSDGIETNLQRMSDHDDRRSDPADRCIGVPVVSPSGGLDRVAVASVVVGACRFALFSEDPLSESLEGDTFFYSASVVAIPFAQFSGGFCSSFCARLTQNGQRH